MLQFDLHLLFGRTVGGKVKGAVVEDNAILVDFDECGSLMFRCAVQRVLQMFDIDIDRAGHERRLTADGT